jgi:hypothetical protein
MKRYTILLIFLSSLCRVSAQDIKRVTFEDKTYYNVQNFDLILDTSYIPKTNLPDGDWIFFAKDSSVRYIWQLKENKVHGKYIEYQNGVFWTSGNYYKDSCWTFLSNRNSNRFKEGYWTISLHWFDSSGYPVGVQAKADIQMNLWYESGQQKLQKNQGTELYYYQNGLLEKILMNYRSDLSGFEVEQYFDSLGLRSKKILRSKVETQNLFGRVNNQEIITVETKYQNGFIKSKTTIYKKHKTTILYDSRGQVVRCKKNRI